MNDYKELIENLRMAGKSVELADGSFDIYLLTVEKCHDAADAIEQLVKERDAATLRDCDYCKWFVGYDCTDFEHETCHGEHWEWRGVQEVEQ